ncbi:hypothetical protein HY469_03595 [Candidatus Roizmanbacteria bacterium]|nr:hypothetical protein [Candidatus Roizmanbacteria bacterium]
MKNILIISSFIFLFFLPQQAFAQSCNIPSSCAPGENQACETVIAPFPCFGPNDSISGQVGTIGNFNQITADDNGMLGTRYEDTEENDIQKACGADGDNLQDQVWPLCKDTIILPNPNPDLPAKGFWWRMHDHEGGLGYELSVCRQPLVNGNCPDWGSPIQTAEIHTSGEGCGYVCSDNDDLHAPFGNGDQGCQSAIPDARTCQLENRVDWPCAISFDEHTWSPAGCGGETVTAFKLKFIGSNGHVHIADVIWIYDSPGCTIQGIKVPASNSEYATQMITLKDANGQIIDQTTSQPYYFTNLPGNRQYTVEASGADLRGSTLCINDTNCHSASPGNPAYRTGSSRVVANCPAGGYADLWWHYGSNVTPTPTIGANTPTPSPAPKACGDLCSPANRIDATCASNFCNTIGVCADQDPVGCAAAGTCVCPFATPTLAATPVPSAVHPFCPF